MTDVSVMYGKSMYALAETEGITERVLEDFALVDEVLSKHTQYVVLLDAPTLAIAEKFALLSQAFSQNLHPYTLNFLKILSENKKMHTFASARRAYIKQFNADRGIEEAVAVTAIPLSPSLSEKLAKKLSEMSGKKIVLENKVDPTVLGGITVRMANMQLDASVRTRLNSLLAQITNN